MKRFFSVLCAFAALSLTILSCNKENIKNPPQEQEPEPEPTSVTLTEDFESCEAWAQEIDGWTLVDNDKGMSGDMQSHIPIIGENTQTSWFVYTNIFNSTDFNPHSGEKAIAAIFNKGGTKNDDWLISPRLDGNAQTIKFWARAMNNNYGEETIEILYSTTDTNLDSFSQIEQKSYSAEWTETTFDVPEGALYFALRYVSEDVCMILVDDITYSLTLSSSSEHN